MHSRRSAASKTSLSSTNNYAMLNVQIQFPPFWYLTFKTPYHKLQMAFMWLGDSQFIFTRNRRCEGLVTGEPNKNVVCLMKISLFWGLKLIDYIHTLHSSWQPWTNTKYFISCYCTLKTKKQTRDGKLCPSFHYSAHYHQIRWEWKNDSWCLGYCGKRGFNHSYLSHQQSPSSNSESKGCLKRDGNGAFRGNRPHPPPLSPLCCPFCRCISLPGSDTAQPDK